METVDPSTIVKSWFPSAMLSSIPCTVIVLGVFQVALVNVIIPDVPAKGDVIVPSVVSLTETLIETSLEGWVSSTTANELVVPLSETSMAEPALTVTPGAEVSSSMLYTVKSPGSRLFHAPSVLDVVPRSMATDCISSRTASSTPVTVTVRGVSQLRVVKVRLDGDTVTSPVSMLIIVPRVTSAEGTEFKTTLNVSDKGVTGSSRVMRPSPMITIIAGETEPVSSSRL